MMKIKIVLIISLLICLLNSQAFGAIKEQSTDELINDLESTYGINITIKENDSNINYNSCLIVIGQGLGRFPEGFIKEITDYYKQNDISTNIIINKTEKISNLYSKYEINESKVNININSLQSSLYRNSCVASEEGFVHELGHFISDYIFEVYGYDKLKKEFESLNSGYIYGTWEEGYENTFINRHSASCFREEVVDLIWYSELHTNKLRNISNGNLVVIHKKIQLLANVIEESFKCITKDHRLWNEALPQQPDEWAKKKIEEMKLNSLLPDEYEGIYSSNITKKDFYNLTFNIIEKKIGKEKFVSTFGIMEKEKYVSLDPLKGEVVDTNSKLYTAFQIDLLDENDSNENEYINRLEVAKFFNYVSNKLNKDIANFKVVEFDDIDEVNESEKPFIYYVSSNGLVKGSGVSFKPFINCTYQESYIMLMRLYNFL